MIEIALFCILFIFIFGWKIAGFFDLIFISSLSLSFLTFVILRASINRGTLWLSVFLFLLFNYSLFIVLVNGANDLQIALRSFRALINFLGGAALVHLYWRNYRKKFVGKIILHIYFALVLHGILIFFMFLSDGFRQQIYSLTSAASIVNENTPFLLGLRIPGLTYGLSQTSVLQMYGLFLIPAIFEFWAFSLMRRIIIYSGSIVLLVSILLTGRTGLLLGILFWPAVLILARNYQIPNIFNIKLRPRKLIKKWSIFFVFILMLFAFYGRLPVKFYDYTLHHSSEILQFFMNFGQSPTTEILLKMYFIPDNAIEFIFGSSNLGRGGLGYILSDVGYIRILFAIGIVGSALVIFTYIFGICQAMRLRKSFPSLAWPTTFVLLSSLMLHLKEVALLTRNQFSIQAIMLSACFLVLWAKKSSLKENEKITSVRLKLNMFV